MVFPEIQNQVFTPFFRGISNQGAGLGLSIAQKLIQLMGGEIYLNSQLNKGTIIQFNLPISLPEREEIPQIKTPKTIIGLASDEPEYRILVVDDQLENRQLFVKFLQPLGFQVQEATNGQEALENWFNWRPHLIFIDTQMPITDGYRTIQQIKDISQTEQTIIIAILSGTLESNYIDKLASICDDILCKPFAIEKLLDKLTLHLGAKYRYQDEVIETIDSNTLSYHLTPSSLEMMSPDWIDQVYGAASAGDSHKLYQLIQQIPHQYLSVALGMTDLVNNFNFRQIRDIIQPLLRRN